MGSAYSDVLLPHPVHFLARLTYSMERKSLQVPNTIPFIVFLAVLRIRIRMYLHFFWSVGSGSQNGKNDPQK
jgi:hypothetical protein